MKASLPRINQAKIAGKTVLARVDFNVTVDDDNVILDATKVLENLPTIHYLLKHKVKVLLFSHRSTVKVDSVKTKPSFLPLLPQIEKIINHKLHLLDPRDLGRAKEEIAKSPFGTVFLFDNTRLHPGEEIGDITYAKELAKLGDTFIYDAFASYRPEATTVALPRFLPTYIGFTMQREIAMLSSIFKKPKRPLLSIIGGAKTEIKVGIVRRFLQVSDTIILGGGVANTFLHAWGIHLGSSLVDIEMIPVARELLWMALHSRVALELPHDFIIAPQKDLDNIREVSHTDIAPDYAALDIGPATRRRFDSIIQQAGTIVWNGPMGKYEDPRFSSGTLSVLESIIKTKAKKIVGGGDTITALPKEKRGAIDHISTGGGAMLVYLESGTTPPIEAIRKYQKKHLK